MDSNHDGLIRDRERLEAEVERLTEKLGRANAEVRSHLTLIENLRATCGRRQHEVEVLEGQLRVANGCLEAAVGGAQSLEAEVERLTGDQRRAFFSGYEWAWIERVQDDPTPAERAWEKYHGGDDLTGLFRTEREKFEAEVAGLEALVERLRGLLADASEVIEKYAPNAEVLEQIEAEWKGDAPCQKSESK